MHPAGNAHGMPARMTPDEVVVADSTQDRPLISYVSSKYLVADSGYGTDANEDWVVAHGMEPVMPLRSYRMEPRECDRDPNRPRRLVEIAFLKFQQNRAEATRHAERTASFLAILRIRAPVI